MRLRGLPGVLVLAAILLFVLPSAFAFYTDWLWFRELGYEGLFLKSLNAQTMVFGGTFAIVYLFLYFNLRFARRRTAERPRIVLGAGADGRPISLEGRQLASLAVPVSLAAALMLGLAGESRWMTWLTFLHQTSFGTVDPLLHRDVSFYVFGLPLYQLIRQQALIVTLIALAGCSLYYVFSGSFVIESRPAVSAWPRIRLVPSARRHLSLLTTIVFLLMAWGAWLEVPNTLLTPTPLVSSVTFGAAYSDVYGRIPFLWITIVILGIGAALSLWHGFGRRSWPLPLAIVLYVGVSAIGGVYAGFLQRLVVTPNEQNVERPYIEYNIAATRRAYNLDSVEEREFTGDAELTAADIIANAGTIENVRLWDHGPLLGTLKQIQEFRTYYEFNSVDNDRYMIDGKLRQVMLSARELNTDDMSTRTWVNERLSFTHGYGIALGPVNQVTTEGMPVLFVRNLPPESTVDLPLREPSLYFGELSNSYALVKTQTPEFHYPVQTLAGENNKTTFYEGTGGVPVGSFMRRLMFAVRFGSTDILLTNQLTRESRIMFHREIKERVQLLAPFLAFDLDPYPVVSGGRIFWMQDAYTRSANYPYSTPTTSAINLGDFNYVRNSVKIVIDAYNGSVTFYLAEPDDPLIKTIGKIFPGLLRPLADMPSDLRAHVRYPEDIFRVQTQLYATYHMTNPQVFYNKEDQWQIPFLEIGQNSVPMTPYYTVMKLPGESKPEFIQMLPFTPRAKDNLAAWIAARSDGAHYGKLFVYQFPKDKQVYGPRQIVGRIGQDPVISKEITLWGQQGSEVVQGSPLVIPINESLLYVRPLYLRSTQTNIPELKRVIVAYQSRIVMDETLVKALAQIFGRSVATALAPDQLASTATSIVHTADVGAPVPAMGETAEPPETVASLISTAQSHRANAEAALKAGDLALYAEEIRKAFAAVDKAAELMK